MPTKYRAYRLPNNRQTSHVPLKHVRDRILIATRHVKLGGCRIRDSPFLQSLTQTPEGVRRPGYMESLELEESYLKVS